jgi:hypothetical protein
MKIYYKKYIQEKILKYHSYIIWPCLIFMMAYYSYELLKYNAHNYKTGDWLINYDYGFVRRGFIGSLFTSAVKIFNLSSSGLVWTIFAVQNTFYILIFYFIQKIYLLNKKNYFTLLLFFSPAYILFPYYDFAGGYRKEIITFLAFTILTYHFCKQIKSTKIIWASLALYIIAILSHETAIFTLPFFLFIILKIRKNNLLTVEKTRQFLILFIASASIGFVASILSSLDAERNFTIVNNTCEYFLNLGFDKKICETAFMFISRSFSEHLIDRISSIYSAITINSLLFFVSILPVFFSDWIRNKENKLIAIIGIIFILPLFIIAHDWGRWIHIYIFFLFTVILADTNKNKYRNKIIPTFFVIGYLFLWSLPHCCTAQVGDGIFLKQLNIIKLYQEKKYQ